MSAAALRRAAWVAGVLVCACIAVLAVDWGIAFRRAPQDDRTVKEMQKMVRQDAAAAPKLEAEQKRITDALRSRRSRDHAVGWGMLACASVFLASIKRLITLGGRKAVEKSRIDAAKAPVGKKRKRKSKHPRTVRAEAPSTSDVSFVDRAVMEHGRCKEAVVPLLQAIQRHYRYLPDEALRRLCEITEITPAEIAGTSSFYGQFRRSPVGEHIVRVCHGTACHVAGARQISEELRRHLKIPEGADTDAGRLFTIEEVACLGCCSLAPVLMVDDHTAGRLTPSTASAALEEAEQKEPA